MTNSTEVRSGPPSLGGQAVIEGVMIRGPKGAAVCVRKPDGEIACRTERAHGGSPVRGMPILRGITALADTMTQGMRGLIWSAQVAAGREPEEPSESQVRMSTIASLAAMSMFFVLAPAVDRRSTSMAKRLRVPKRLNGAFEGFARVGMLVGYLRAVGRMPQAQRLFAYHGAEHRAIQAYEAGEPLEVQSLDHFPNAHVRCGTSFLLTSTVLSSLVFGALGPQTFRARLLTRLALMPIVAGLSYEAIRLASVKDNAISRLIFRPNMQLQALTTRDPDHGQMEVALAAVRAALALHEA